MKMIGNTWHETEGLPVCLQFDDAELEAIKGMTKESAPNNRFASVPDPDREHVNYRCVLIPLIEGVDC